MMRWGQMGCDPRAGQLAVGLAFAFAGILLMFGLVFNSSLNTRDKMKIQTTSDYAALIAADVQRHNLNFIRELNIAIEAEWVALEIALNMPHCNRIISECGGNPQCVAGKALGKTFEQALSFATNPQSSGGKGKVKNDAGSQEVCDAWCDEYDRNVKNKYVDYYDSQRTPIASTILTSIEQGNGIAFDIALNTFLSPQNLPLGLFLKLNHEFGDFTLDQVKSEYAQGNLSNEEYAYQIMEQSKNDPLFIPMEESRTTYHSDFTYNTQYIDYPVPRTLAACLPSFPIGTPQMPMFLPYRITRTTDYTTHFFTGIKYTPPANIVEKMLNIGIRNPDTTSEEFGKEIEHGNEKLKLLQRGMRSIFAMSAAKPFGGTFPNAGDVTGSPIGLVKMFINRDTDNFSAFGTSGKKFEGSKLFGIADKGEIGNQRLGRADNCIEQKDMQGNETRCVPFYAEDFLH